MCFLRPDIAVSSYFTYYKLAALKEKVSPLVRVKGRFTSVLNQFKVTLLRYYHILHFDRSVAHVNAIDLRHKLEAQKQLKSDVDEPSPSLETGSKSSDYQSADCKQLETEVKCCHTVLNKVADVISEVTQTERKMSDVGTSTTSLVQNSTKRDVMTQTTDHDGSSSEEPGYVKQDTVIQPHFVTQLSGGILHEGNDKPRLRRSSRIAAKNTEKSSEIRAPQGSDKESSQMPFLCESQVPDSQKLNLIKVLPEALKVSSEKDEMKKSESTDKTEEVKRKDSTQKTAPVNSWPCAKQNCLTCSALTSGSCSTQGTIYLITCLVNNCQATYIGETHRKLNERFTEHWRTCANPHFESYKMRAMSMHYATAHSGAKPELRLEILAKMKGQKKRRERESQLILERKPSLNIYRPNFSMN